MDAMGIISVILSVFAMVAALASVWFTSETIKKANSSNQQFYEANVKGMVTTLEQLAKASVELNGKVEILEKDLNRDVEQSMMSRIQDAEGAVGEIRALVEQLEKFAPGSPKQMNF